MSFQGSGKVYVVEYSASKADGATKPLTSFRHAGGKKMKPGERPTDWPFEPGELPKEMVHGTVVVFIRQPNQQPKYGQKSADDLATVSLHRMRYTPVAWVLTAFGMIGIVGCVAIGSFNSKPNAASVTPVWLWVLLGVCVMSALLGFFVFGSQREGRVLLEINSQEMRVPCNRQQFATADIERMVVAEWEDTIASGFGYGDETGSGVGLRILVFFKSGERIELPTFFMDFGREKFVTALKKVSPLPIVYHDAYREIYCGGRHFGCKPKFEQPWRDSEQVRPDWE